MKKRLTTQWAFFVAQGIDNLFFPFILNIAHLDNKSRRSFLISNKLRSELKRQLFDHSLLSL